MASRTTRSPSRSNAIEPPPTARRSKSDASIVHGASGATHSPAHFESLYQLLISTIRDYAIFILDPKGNVRTWNAGAQRFKGYTADEICGKHFSIFYEREDVEAGKPERELVEATRVGRLEDEGWRLRKDGSRFWANVVITALRAENGELVGFAKVTRDLTERREAELGAVDDARRIAEAETESRTRSEFLASMSHELRTPLNAIGGYADLLRAEIAGPLTEEQKRYVTRITRSQGDLLAIINDLLNYSRTKAGKLRYEITSVRVKDVLHQTSTLMQTSIRLKGLTLTVLPPPVGMFARADRWKMEQVLVNLLSNALKFTEAGGTITVSAEQQGPVINIAMSDTGRGIPKDNLEKIFEPFVQLGRSLTSDDVGTGLGLAISREIAKGMGGNLTVKSELNHGSTFTFTLPAAPEP